MSDPHIAVLGEGMIELAGTADRPRLGYGGDALNTAIHLARFGLPTAFFTAIGRDPFSDKLRSDWSKEGLDTSLVLTDPHRHPGLYAIHTDHQGERDFIYWRSQSAARRMFELKGAAEATERAERACLLFFSLISLAILPRRGRELLIGLARRVRMRGGQVAVDGNYRSSLWRNRQEALRARDAAIAVCDIGLPSLDDEQRLTGLTTAEAVAARWRSLGAGEVVVKMGSIGALVDDCLVPCPVSLRPLDTTGAGDAFNAGYLAARLSGASAVDAALSGHALGAWAVMRRGAIPPVDELAPYRLATPRAG